MGFSNFPLFSLILLTKNIFQYINYSYYYYKFKKIVIFGVVFLQCVTVRERMIMIFFNNESLFTYDRFS